MKKFKYEVGEELTLRDDLVVNRNYGVINLTSSMSMHRRNKFTIIDKHRTNEGNYYTVKETSHYFSEEMFCKSFSGFKDFIKKLDVIE